ncbi:predicted protein [Ostreococcus lucimarinus CCE9901]|uniref:WRKY domain-containing protein n=1 Tax=Ostreococcus lucimarinus (strain CCE9901) TaxID=436017 RepID=A4S4Z2_OSTLU|nr:predicted protein [Ostreococcus lucimarinus CCE9901]ABO98812.1 predicted protein [Ostreococcus lucimarinus CCE9901]|eukprot:XP_001420519.1 predicted protein [Ostreococcus lucimarinus CCE9901]
MATTTTHGTRVYDDDAGDRPRRSYPHSTSRSTTTVAAHAPSSAHADGYRWRKYGQKNIKGSSFPRSYYRCTERGCPARKKTELRRASEDGEMETVVCYEGEHTHAKPSGGGGRAETLAPGSTKSFGTRASGDSTATNARRGTTRFHDVCGGGGGGGKSSSGQATESDAEDSAASEEDSTRTAVEHDETEALGVRKIAKWSSITDDVQRIRTVRARAPRILVQRRRGEEAETRRESAEPVVRRHG